MPKVSCIVACYNAASTLEAAVRSALAQDGVDVEVIVSDDCSTDASLGKARAMAAADPRVRVVAQERRGGPSQARNKAMDVAQGDWIAVLDADDEMLPQRLLRLVSAAEAGGFDLAFDNQRIIADASDTAGPPVLAFDYEDGLSIDVGTLLRLSRTRAGRMAIGYAKPVFSTSFLRRHGLEYDERFSVGEDWKFFLTTLAVGGRGVYVNDPMYLYYRPASSLTLSGKNNYRVALDMALSCQKDLATRLQLRDKRAIRSYCKYLWRKAAERTLRNAARALKAAAQSRLKAS